MSNMKKKHYSVFERKTFLQIIKKYKHVTEVRKNDSFTHGKKEMAWMAICTEYNYSPLVSQKRTVQQLKKLWSNMKQIHRDALSAERQSAQRRIGEALTKPLVKIEPDVADTSSVTDIKANEQNIVILDVFSQRPIKSESSIDNSVEPSNPTVKNDSKSDEIGGIENENPNVLSDARSFSQRGNADKVALNSRNSIEGADSVSISKGRSQSLHKFQNFGLAQSTPNSSKASIPISLKCSGDDFRKRPIHAGWADNDNDEANLRLERIYQIMQEEQKLADFRIQHEKHVAQIKIQHLLAINALELQRAAAAAEKAELELKKEKQQS